MNIGVVIGSFGMPAAVALNIAAIRQFNGPDVPILVHDDSTPPDRDSHCFFHKKHSEFELYRTPKQLGHVPGDISCFVEGLKWANERGLKYLVKLSQRFIFTQQNWLTKSAEECEELGIITLTQSNAIHGIRPWGYDGIRSECVLMQVKSWNRLEVIQALKSYPATPEHSVAEVARKHVHPQVPIGRWRMFGPDKAAKRNDVLWHDANSDDDYQALAEKLAVDMAGFSSAGWNHLLGTAWKLF